MKKNILVTILLSVLVVNIFSLAGFGFHIGTDFIKVDEINKEFTVEIENLNYSSFVKRDAIENPFALGCQLYLDPPIIPIGFEAGFGASFQKYSWRTGNQLTANGESLNLDLPGIDTENGEYKEDFIFGRISTDLTAKYYFFKLPMFKFYAGAGGGMYFISPLVSEELFIQNLEGSMPANTDTIEMDIEELVKKEVGFGYHGVLGMRLKPVIIPFSFNLDYKHNFAPENDYGDETNAFGTFKISANFYF